MKEIGGETSAMALKLVDGGPFGPGPRVHPA